MPTCSTPAPENSIDTPPASGLPNRHWLFGTSSGTMNAISIVSESVIFDSMPGVIE